MIMPSRNCNQTNSTLPLRIGPHHRPIMTSGLKAHCRQMFSGRGLYFELWMMVAESQAYAPLSGDVHGMGGTSTGTSGAMGNHERAGTGRTTVGLGSCYRIWP